VYVEENGQDEDYTKPTTEEEKEEIAQRNKVIEEIRSTLRQNREERGRTSKTGAALNGHAEARAESDGSIIPDERNARLDALSDKRKHAENAGAGGPDAVRSPEEPRRNRPKSRRSSSDSSSIADTSRLVAADSPSRKEAASKKFGLPLAHVPGLGAASVLSKKEAEELAAPLQAALADYCLYVDQWIWSQTKDTTEQPVWSDLDEQEIAILARVWISRGKRSKAAAHMVRMAIESSDYIATLIITIPRTINTIDRVSRSKKRENRG
jgi:hypothetical protein